MKLAAAFALTGVIAAAHTLSQAPPRPPAPPTRVIPVPERNEPGLVSKTMTGLDAMSFASALAKAGHAAGFVMPGSVRQGMLPPDSGEMITLDEAVASFTARGQYRVTRDKGALVFTHADAPAEVLNALNAVRTHYAIKGTFSLALYDVVLRSLSRRQMGRVSTPEPGAGPECPVEQHVSIPAGRASAIGVMNALVTRAKGVAWQVRFGRQGAPGRLQVGYVCANGVWSALSAPGW